MPMVMVIWPAQKMNIHLINSDFDSEIFESILVFISLNCRLFEACEVVNLWSIVDSSVVNRRSIADSSVVNLWSIVVNRRSIADSSVVNRWSIVDSSVVNLWSIVDSSFVNRWSIFDSILMNLWSIPWIFSLKNSLVTRFSNLWSLSSWMLETNSMASSSLKFILVRAMSYNFIFSGFMVKGMLIFCISKLKYWSFHDDLITCYLIFSNTYYLIHVT